jgi:hypothetical protein
MVTKVLLTHKQTYSTVSRSRFVVAAVVDLGFFRSPRLCAPSRQGKSTRAMRFLEEPAGLPLPSWFGQSPSGIPPRPARNISGGHFTGDAHFTSLGIPGWMALS